MTNAAAVANHATAARVVTESRGEGAAALGLLGRGPSAPLDAASPSASEACVDRCWGAAGDVMPQLIPSARGPKLAVRWFAGSRRSLNQGSAGYTTGSPHPRNYFPRSSPGVGLSIDAMSSCAVVQLRDDHTEVRDFARSEPRARPPRAGAITKEVVDAIIF